MIPAMEIDADGNVHTLYHEAIDLFALGTLTNVRRASHVRFDEARQEWTVVDGGTGEIVHRDRSRTAAIEWEITHYQAGGDRYRPRSQDHE